MPSTLVQMHHFFLQEYAPAKLDSLRTGPGHSQVLWLMPCRYSPLFHLVAGMAHFAHQPHSSPPVLLAPILASVREKPSNDCISVPSRSSFGAPFWTSNHCFCAACLLPQTDPHLRNNIQKFFSITCQTDARRLKLRERVAFFHSCGVAKFPHSPSRTS